VIASMEVKEWGGGLFEQEVKAIQKIKEAFTSKKVEPSATRQIGGSLKDQLASGYGINDCGMFPWKGYAGFRLVSSKGQEGEFDLVIVTHCNVIIVELKDWNHDPVTCKGDRWYKGDKDMSRSPVSVTRNKKYTIENKLRKIKHRFTNKGFVPFVEFFVVMTGSSDFSRLPPEELHHTISLRNFLKFSDKEKFQKKFRPHPNAQVLNRDFDLFDEIFGTTFTAPKSIRIGGFEAVDKIFEHPKNVYQEYFARSEASANAAALLRIWDFGKLDGMKASTAEGRASIVSREREVLQSINHISRDLYNHCLRSLTSFEKEEVTSQYSELYELPPGHMRFNEFIGTFVKEFTEKDRITVAKLILSKFSDLHSVKIAHRDIGDHSLWISPAKEVALSNFISAYHQPSGTVGDYRGSLSVVEASSVAAGKNDGSTPFEQDTQALAKVTWHLLTATRMSPKSQSELQDKLPLSQKWYGSVLLDALDGKFSSASEYFDSLMLAEPEGEDIPTFDESELDPYRHSINHLRQYREDDEFILETDEKEVYVSGGHLVKAWLNCDVGTEEPVVSFRVLSFLKRVEKLRDVGPKYLPTIRGFGIAAKSSSLYLVTDFIEGVTWNKIKVSDEEKMTLIVQLVSAVDDLHSHSVQHGDIHPENVIVDVESCDLFLIDIPDFSMSGEEQKNHSYSPENIDSRTAAERDNYAVVKMSCELLGFELGVESAHYESLAVAAKTELDDREFGFKELGRFKAALDKFSVSSNGTLLEVTVGSGGDELAILPDNERLYVKVEPNTKNTEEIRVTFNGIGGSFSTFYNKKKQEFITGFTPRKRSTISRRDISESQFEINCAVLIKPGRPNELGALSLYFKDSEPFDRAIRLLEYKETESVLVDKQNSPTIKIIHKPKKHKETLSLKKLSSNSRSNESDESEPVSEPISVSVKIQTAKLWRAILDTETESNPKINVSGEVVPIPDSYGELIIPYTADTDPLGVFDKSDEVDAIIVDKNGVDTTVGIVSISKSDLNEVRIARANKHAYNLQDSALVYFRSRRDRASFNKRKKALECLLVGKGLIPDLMDRFEPSCELPAVKYDVTVSDSELSRYDRDGGNGNTISLNEQQRAAFRKILNHGPLSLLQGPPGTGKTEFIAAFVHHLVDKQGVRNILLVSQSHEAVNTAAERIRKHCARLETDLEVVRFSNREGAVSSGLKDVYSNALTTERREIFSAECKYRVEALSNALGLEKEFISSYVLAELSLFKLIDNHARLEKQLNQQVENNQEESDLDDLKTVLYDLDMHIRSEVISKYEITLEADAHVSSTKSKIVEKLCSDYAVRPVELKRVVALAKITRDMQDALSAERVNLDEFYARSRQLVTGTCVGIGQGHIGIQDNVYDWVIIDEAARSISSELAIAMRSAKRVLLVGDHLQLPPLYSETHKEALCRKLGVKNDRSEIEELLQSDFERSFNSHYGQQTSARLLTQYRMSPPIGSLVSTIFYSGELVNGNNYSKEIYSSAPDVIKNPVTWLDTSDEGEKAHHTQGEGSSIYNRCEADHIISALRRISEDGEFFSSLSKASNSNAPPIGVICMYAEQKRVLRQKFSQVLWVDGFKELVKIDTVDSYQGKENKIIILSVTRSEKQGRPGFLRTPNRINVAMSRAMDRLLIVGNSNMWMGTNETLPLGQVLKFMRKQGTKEGYAVIGSKSLLEASS